MLKRIVIEIEIPDGPMANIILDRIFDGTIQGLNVAKRLPKFKFTILHQRIEDYTENVRSELNE